MSDSTKQKCIEEFLRKSLLGEELVHTQFHLFSARSSPSRRVLRPQVLCANNVLLAKSSKYFLDLLSSDIDPSDPSLVDLTDDNDVPNNARITDYGYGSDSDLDDCNDLVVNTKTPKDQSATLSNSTKMCRRTRSKGDDKSSDDESVRSDMFVLSPEQPRAREPFSVSKDRPGSVASSETAVQEGCGNKTLANYTAMRLRSLGSRHILIKDTAFQTWYTLLNYLYTDKFNFLPLNSATFGRQPHQSPTNSLDVPTCSAKSMYRLACKVGLDDLRDQAFSFIQENLTEHNILKELSCSLLSKHPELLEMELDVLYAHILSTPVVANFAVLAQRIANKELPHGADIIVGIHTRILMERRPLPLKPPPPTPSISPGGNQVKLDVKANDTSEGGDKDKTGPSHMGKPGPLPQSSFNLWGSTNSTPAPSLFTGSAAPTLCLAKDPPKPGGTGNTTETLPLQVPFGAFAFQTSAKDKTKSDALGPTGFCNWSSGTKPKGGAGPRPLS